MLSQMVRRRMLIWETQPVKPYKGRGAKYQRIYSVEPKMGGVYELWPEVVPSKPKSDPAQTLLDLTPKTPATPMRVVGEAAPEVIPPLQTKPQVVTIAQSQDFIDGLTVAEARALYQHLHKMFG